MKLSLVFTTFAFLCAQPALAAMDATSRAAVADIVAFATYAPAVCASVALAKWMDEARGVGLMMQLTEAEATAATGRTVRLRGQITADGLCIPFASEMLDAHALSEVVRAWIDNTPKSGKRP
jgi:hypothetical protein